jgi:hypothetical protein
MLSLIIALALLSPASAATVRGTLALPGVVWVSDGSAPVPGPEQLMRQHDKTFVPDLVVVSVGGSVRFPNDDNFYHSVYSASDDDPFDIGFYDTGPGKLVTFATAGVDQITCHIHAIMHATVVVVDGPWARTMGNGQGFILNNVRPGKHDLHVWSLDGGERKMPLDVPNAAARVILTHAM